MFNRFKSVVKVSAAGILAAAALLISLVPDIEVRAEEQIYAGVVEPCINSYVWSWCEVTMNSSGYLPNVVRNPQISDGYSFMEQYFDMPNYSPTNHVEFDGIKYCVPKETATFFRPIEQRTDWYSRYHSIPCVRPAMVQTDQGAVVVGAHTGEGQVHLFDGCATAADAVTAVSGLKTDQSLCVTIPIDRKFIGATYAITYKMYYTRNPNGRCYWNYVMDAEYEPVKTKTGNGRIWNVLDVEKVFEEEIASIPPEERKSGFHAFDEEDVRRRMINYKEVVDGKIPEDEEFQKVWAITNPNAVDAIRNGTAAGWNGQ